jgi:BirA family transcriptional regulator, biotin operon repressor / biotin---[acetyl-CoA-carboxylase] ligase
MDKRTTAGREPLRPDTILSMSAGCRLGNRIHYLKEVDSTNLFAVDLANQGAPEGEIVVAETQMRGKGRLGRPWVSPPFMNLYLSVILRPTLPPRCTPQLTLACAVAVAESVAAVTAVKPEIKWPNDILVEGKKLAGILTESSCEGGRVRFVVVGIGVNINFAQEAMPETIRERATSLLIVTGSHVDRSKFTGQLIQSLDRCYVEVEEKGFSFVRPRWERYFRLKGKKVRVESPGQPVRGMALGINREGELLVESESGEVERIIAGDLVPVEE